MSFIAHDLIILDKVSYEKLSVCTLPYSTVIHPVSCKRTWPFTQLQSKTTLSREKMPFKIQNHITSVREKCLLSPLCFPFNLLFQPMLLNIPPTLYLQRVSTSPFPVSTLVFAFSFLSSVIFLPSYL